MLFFASSRFPGTGGKAADEQNVEAGDESTVEEGGESLEIARGTDGVHGSGAYSCKNNGETNPVQNLYRELKAQQTDELVWRHTMGVFEQIEAGKVYTG